MATKTKTDSEGRTLGLMFRDSFETDHFDGKRNYRVTLGVVTVDPARKIRNADAFGGFDIRDLEIGAYGSEMSGQRKLYGWNLEYRSPYTVDVSRAERMLRTLRTLHKRVDAIKEQYGPAETFGHYVVRVANALGAESIIFDKKEGQSDDHEHTFWILKDGAWAINARVDAQYLKPQSADDDSAA